MTEYIAWTAKAVSQDGTEVLLLQRRAFEFHGYRSNGDRSEALGLREFFIYKDGRIGAALTRQGRQMFTDNKGAVLTKTDPWQAL